MKNPIIAFILSAALVSAVAVEVSLTPEESAVCAANGGFLLVPTDFIRIKLKEAYQAGVERGLAGCHIKSI